MLMFQSGLLSTFIPEIIMVIGFVLCLFTPGFQSHNTSVENTSIVAQVSNFDSNKTSAYQVSSYDFQNHTETVLIQKQYLPLFVEKSKIIAIESPFSTSNGLSYVDFSRPPPFFL
jgi:hypothetical protein